MSDEVIVPIKRQASCRNTAEWLGLVEARLISPTFPFLGHVVICTSAFQGTRGVLGNGSIMPCLPPASGVVIDIQLTKKLDIDWHLEILSGVKGRHDLRGWLRVAIGEQLQDYDVQLKGEYLIVR